MTFRVAQMVVELKRETKKKKKGEIEKNSHTREERGGTRSLTISLKNCRCSKRFIRDRGSFLFLFVPMATFRVSNRNRF